MIRKAVIKDVKQIYRLINYYAAKDKMLRRSEQELYEDIRDFFVYETNGRIDGCCAMHIWGKALAEIKSLAVRSKMQDRGIGSALVKNALKEADELNIEKVFALTYAPEFFERHGFSRVNKNRFPQKIWSECVHCARFPKCDEVALVKKI